MEASKNILEGKVVTRDNKTFTVQKVGDSEQEIQIVFDSAVNYRVVKLDVGDLPAQDTDGKKITWINNWGIMDASGTGYLDSVQYTVFLPPSSRAAAFVYFDKRGIGRDKTPAERGSKAAQRGMVQVDFSTGDPGAGWK